jgi:osmoprotectant transport system substrate-binding protein
MRAARSSHPQKGRLPSDLTEFVGRRTKRARIGKALDGAPLRAAAVLIALALTSSACTSGSGGGPMPGGRAAGPGNAIIVGSFDFPESVLLADIYSGAIAARGFPVQVMPDLGSRELVDPALMSGLI